jgi:hypothetical protein
MLKKSRNKPEWMMGISSALDIRKREKRGGEEEE